MGGERVPEDIKTRACDQEPHPEALTPMERERAKKYGGTIYQPRFAKLAYDLLAKSTTGKNKSHVCAFLQCSKPTLLLWMAEVPEFKAAIEDGLEAGKAKWYARIAQHAFKPTQAVNNGLIKLLSANIYGIKEEQPQITINNINSEQDPKKAMIERGIPIPDIEIDDIEA